MNDDQEARATFLSVMLSLIALSGAVFFVFVICGGSLAFGVGAGTVMLVLVGVGCLHYFLWGRALNEEVAAEREEDDAQRGAEGNGWPPDEPFRRHPRI